MLNRVAGSIQSSPFAGRAGRFAGRYGAQAGRATRTTREKLTALLSLGSTVANFQAGVGVVGSGNADSWQNQIGVASALTATTTARPAIQADGSLLFNGTSHKMQTGAFTFNQPYTIYMVVKQIAWTANRYLMDGIADNLAVLEQQTAGVSPNIRFSTDITNWVGPNADLAIGTAAVVTVTANGASSALGVASNAESTGNAGAQNMGGLTLGANGGTASVWSNIQVWEVIMRNGVDSAQTKAAIQNYLKAIYGL